jgi:hypothetical protein
MKTDDLYQFFGSAIKAAKAIGVQRATFYTWIERGYIPIKQQKNIELLTKGKLVSDKNKNHKFYESDVDSSIIYLPAFRYYDKKHGMCNIESMHFRHMKVPKIIYVTKGNKKKKFTVFTSENIMQAIDMVDCDGKTVYEGDVCLINKKEKFVFESIEMTKKLKKLGKFKIIGNIFE